MRIRHIGSMKIDLTPEILITAYAQGVFPMADSGDSDEVHWVLPERRGQLSIADMHVPRRLKKNVRQMKLPDGLYEIKINHDFKAVVEACAQISDMRDETWINQDIIDVYCELHEAGLAHSVECWQKDGGLVGGLYGISIGGAFFGESMFSRQRDASKVALVHLVARLYHAGFEILDTQFTNAHLEQFGVYEVAHKKYMERLTPALEKPCVFDFEEPSERALIKQYLER